MAVTLLDERGGFLKTIHTDASDDNRMVEVTQQDVDPLIDWVKERREHGVDKEMKLAAVIPAAIAEQMMRDGSFNDPAAIKRWCNDPQNECFRVWKGKL